MNITSGHSQLAKTLGFANEFEMWAEHRCGHLMPKRCSDDHLRLANRLVELTTGKIPNNRLAIHGYRAMGKTRWVGPIFVPWLICETDIPEIQIISQSGGATGLSTKIARQIMDELADPVKISDYGYKKGSQWAKEHFQVVRCDGSTIDVYCRGKHSTLRGQRGMIIFEDIQDVDDVTSETILERDEEWLFGDALNVPGPDDPVLWISNFLSPVSLAAKIEMLPGWTIEKFYAENPPHSGKSSWPEMYSNDYLKFKYGELGRDRYNAEFLLEPRVSGNPPINPAWFRFYDPASQIFNDFLETKKYTVIGYDGADSVTTSADKTAIVTVAARAYQTDPDFYIREVYDGHTTLNDGIARLFGMKDRMDANETVVESRVKKGNKGPQEEAIEEYERVESKILRATIVRPEKDKLTRILYVQGMFQAGKIYFNPKDQLHQRLMTQLTLFTGDQLSHDDLVDALVHALTAHKNRLTRALDERATPYIHPSVKPSEMTGVV